jgi:DNA-binding transcriptional MerR regulator
MSKNFLPVRALRKRYQVSTRTIDRWVQRGVIPAPAFISGQRYWDEALLEENERASVAHADGKSAHEEECAA